MNEVVKSSLLKVHMTYEMRWCRQGQRANEIPNGANHEDQCFQCTFPVFSSQRLNLLEPDYIRNAP